MNIGQEIDIRNVVKYYGKFLALNDINLHAEAGDFLTILGSSGSGKTTLLKCIAGFEPLQKGTIHIGGSDIAPKKAYERNIGMLFQNYSLFPHMTVAENIAYPLKLRKIPRAEIRKRVADILDLVKLTGMEQRYPKQLSGGQQQRVALARAIVYNPPLLLLDEPLGALDKNLRHEMQFEIKRIQKDLGITAISVTHDQEEALTMSDRICIMSQGEVQQVGVPEEIYNKPKNKFVAEFMGTTNLYEAEITDCEQRGNRLVMFGTCDIGPGRFSMDVPAQGVGYVWSKAMFAIRPECVHHCRENEEQPNSFRGTILESLYLGDGMRLRVQAQGRELHIKLSMEEFRTMGRSPDQKFYFNPDTVSLIYDERKGTRLYETRL